MAGASSLLTTTNVLTLVFLLWSGSTLSTLYRVINPLLPPLHDEAGRVLPLTVPLWAAAPHGLALSLRLSDASLHGGGGGAAKEHAVDLLGGAPLGGLSYGWDLLPPRLGGGALDTELVLEVLLAPGGSGKASGLRLTCERDALGEYSPVCLALARRRGGAGQARARDFAQEAATVLKKGVLTSLVSGAARALGLGGSPGEGEEEGGAGGGAVPLEVYSETSAAAAALGRALLRGRPVFLQSTLAWAAEPAAAAAAPGGAGPRRARASGSSSSLQALLARMGGGDGGKDAGVAAALAAALASIAPAAVPSELTRLTAETPLVQSVPYIAPIRRRFLWRSALGEGSALPLALGVSLEGEARARAEERALAAAAARANASGSSSGGARLPPQEGQPSPHFVGQVDLRLIQDSAAFPRDAMPRHAGAHLRAARLPLPGGGAPLPVYLPHLAANPVRPTRDRLLPLNASSTHLALRLTLAPMAAGAWNLMAMMDGSITAQHSLGATARDTDDVIRLLNDTPSWLLVTIFGVTFLHLLFELLATRADVSFWAGAKDFRGISVRSLGISAASQAVITLYLAREGSSLLVTLPQGAGVALALWKLSRASGWVWGRAFWCLPYVRYDAALGASGGAGAAGAYDREAVSAMSALLAPLLAGAALRSLLHDMHASWLDWALGTAVAAVYGFGFALMTPQLWMNYRLRSVAHLPWGVLGFRFFNTIIDDVFAAFIKMPLCVRARGGGARAGRSGSGSGSGGAPHWRGAP